MSKKRQMIDDVVMFVGTLLGIIKREDLSRVDIREITTDAVTAAY